MEVIIQEDNAKASLLAADRISRLVREKPDAVLGLATGGTPVQVYRELIRRHREEGLDFSRITTFNLDEYLGLSPEHPDSYAQFMHENLFAHVNLAPDRTHLPCGLARDLPAHCRDYEQSIKDAGGIDLQLLGIGSDGHIGFNEPISSLASRTRAVALTEETIADNARFFASADEVPRHAITMGIGTILESRACLLLAFGGGKAAVLAEAVEGPVRAAVPASALQMHPNVTVVCDEAAAAKFQRAAYYRQS